MSLRLLLATCLLVPFVLIAQQASRNSPVAPGTHHAPILGSRLFQSHCASCHGSGGKGNGPAAVSLKSPPPDLTTIARRNGGTFPTLHVMEAINGDRLVPAHGSRDMPVWGPVFRDMAHGHADNAHLRITNLTSYIESLQEK